MKLVVNGPKCTGCRLCQVVCSLVHFNEINPKKAALAIDAKLPKPGRFEPRVCSQCGTCASVCPEQAISEEDSVYILHQDKCIACGECVKTCPEKVIFLPEDSSIPIKCDLCKECISVCTPGALLLKK